MRINPHPTYRRRRRTVAASALTGLAAIAFVATGGIGNADEPATTPDDIIPTDIIPTNGEWVHVGDGPTMQHGGGTLTCDADAEFWAETADAFPLCFSPSEVEAWGLNE